MPELPEVETVVRQVRPLIVGATLVRTRIVDTARLKPSLFKGLRGRVVSAVFRVGKEIIVEFGRPAASNGRATDSESIFLCIHLRMTGRLVWSAGSQARRASVERRTHQRAWLLFDRGRLFFVDVRRFGTLRVLKDRESLRTSGLDPLAPGFGPRPLEEVLAHSSQEIKAWLLRQDRLVGIGNIYANEILYAAKINPTRGAGSLNDREIRSLARAIVKVLAAAIAACGTTFSDFQGADGQIGTYQRYLRVYQREGQTCGRCDEIIARRVQQGRSTFFCAGCQR